MGRNSAQLIGRVGRLAVAPGVGAAVYTGTGVAWASEEPGGIHPAMLDKVDFLGVQYYGSQPMSGFGVAPLPGFPFLRGFPIRCSAIEPTCSDLNRPTDPGGFREVLEIASSYGKPLWVTENGTADADDSKRPSYIVNHIAVAQDLMARSAQNGMDIRATRIGRPSTISNGPADTTCISGSTVRTRALRNSTGPEAGKHRSRQRGHRGQRAAGGPVAVVRPLITPPRRQVHSRTPLAAPTGPRHRGARARR